MDSTTFKLQTSLDESEEGFRVRVSVIDAMWPWTRVSKWHATREGALGEIPDLIARLYRPRRPAPDIDDY